ncbi:MAG: histidinol-phosphatase [Ardenticatenaceae bacterium]|nr:histidinol-phosphatase [Ardenticatenaceae bacterium]MCB8989415.1 histidinol-phosphatase [Ardenticatenaceae bacterium]MCB9004570.1 histidinol-phosphatase [Ardenticatenaceae bacterium]
MTIPQTFLEFALDAAWQAGRITLGHFQTGVQAERKADNSPVTIADKQAEQKLRELIGRYWPTHGIVGEEYGRSSAQDSPYTWILDPIDGTKSFVSGVPLYATLLALTDGDEALLGIAHFPALNETVYAVRGGGCFWNGRRAHVSSVNKLEDAVLLSSGTSFGNWTEKETAWNRLVDATYIQRTWGDAYGYALVATGRAEIMVDPAMALWDCGPLQVIMEEAGGTFTDWQGNATIHAGESIASNGALFEQVMAIVKRDA